MVLRIEKKLCNLPWKLNVVEAYLETEVQTDVLDGHIQNGLLTDVASIHLKSL